VRIDQFDGRADETSLRVCHEMFLSGLPDDDPNAPPVSFGMFRGWWAYGFSDEPQQIWLARDQSGEPVGCYLLELPERENKSNGFVLPVVARAARRRGIGTALLAHAADQAEHAGRSLLMSDARVGSPGEPFAAAMGGESGMRDARRVLDVDANLHARLPGLRSAALQRASGYSLREWIGVTPDDLVDQTCALYTAMADAPHDEAFEPATWDPARLRAAEKRIVAQGTRWYSVAAMQDATGDMAGLTQVNVDPDVPGWAFQEITAVTRGHRGHRLGLLVKVAMLARLAADEPGIGQIMTFNAVENEHMIGVNAELGHRVSDYFQSYEIAVDAARKLAAAAG
jgi:GNAT superfamily N-acetyltransferase/RimJ/RimL family protein N-acetyltransferase